jgi:hypothetical protein
MMGRRISDNTDGMHVKIKDVDPLGSRVMITGLGRVLLFFSRCNTRALGFLTVILIHHVFDLFLPMYIRVVMIFLL